MIFRQNLGEFLYFWGGGVFVLFGGKSGGIIYFLYNPFDNVLNVQENYNYKWIFESSIETFENCAYNRIQFVIRVIYAICIYAKSYLFRKRFNRIFLFISLAIVKVDNLHLQSHQVLSYLVFRTMK